MMSIYRETEKYQRTCDPSENLTEVAARGTLRPAETRCAIPGHYLVQWECEQDESDGLGYSVWS